jgi:hypothetical protein
MAPETKKKKNGVGDNRRGLMASADYRIESNTPIAGMLWPVKGSQQLSVSDRALAVSLAAKAFTQPSSEIRVVHVPTGEVVFRKPASSRSEWAEEL